MRQPSIHITEERLAAILAEVLETEDKIVKWNTKAMAQQVVSLARGFSLSHRSIAVTNDKLKRDTDKVKLTARSNATLFAEVLTLCRRKAKHRNLKPIKVGTKEFLEIKEITNLATEFCNEFGIPRKEGYIEYVTLHLSKMKGFFRLSNFKYKHGEVIDEYESVAKIKNDPNGESTAKAHAHYLQIIASNTGFAEGFEKVPSEYIHFVDIAQQAKTIGVSVETWIDSQFEGFAWVSAIPQPKQMVGTKAIQRLQKYCYTKGIRMGHESRFEAKKIDFSKIKSKR